MEVVEEEEDEEVRLEKDEEEEGVLKEEEIVTAVGWVSGSGEEVGVVSETEFMIDLKVAVVIDEGGKEDRGAVNILSDEEETLEFDTELEAS